MPKHASMTGGSCHKDDNYTTIHPSNGCKVLTNQNAGNCTTIQLYNYTTMQPYSYRTYVRLLRSRRNMFIMHQVLLVLHAVLASPF